MKARTVLSLVSLVCLLGLVTIFLTDSHAQPGGQPGLPDAIYKVEHHQFGGSGAIFYADVVTPVTGGCSLFDKISNKWIVIQYGAIQVTVLKPLESVFGPPPGTAPPQPK